VVSWDSFGRELGAGLLGGAFATMFFTLALTDMEKRLLPNRIIYPSIVFAVAFSWGWPETSVVEILAGGGVGVLIAAVLLLLSLPFGSEAFGMGDVKMIVLMGFVLGVPSVVVGVFLGTFIAGGAAAFLLITRLRSRKDYIPHGPFLAIGAVIALWWGQNIWDYYIQ
jgi:prepilin signal peptidase PulO-like enzyme (type II secretory pathway)